MPTTTRLSLRYPATSDSADVPRDIGNLASDIDKAAIFSKGTFANRPTSTVGSPGIDGRYYFATDTSRLYLDTGTSWVEVATSPPTYETSLPSTPFDGQEIFYAADSANGVIWHLRYRSAATGSYKWDFVGGAPLTASVATSQSRNSAAYGDLATAGPSITAPLAGDYLLRYGALMGTSSNATDLWTSPSINGNTPADADAVKFYTATSSATYAAGAREVVKTGVNSSGVIKLQYKATGSSAAGNFENRWLVVQPVRIG